MNIGDILSDFLKIPRFSAPPAVPRLPLEGELSPQVTEGVPFQMTHFYISAKMEKTKAEAKNDDH